MIAVVPIKFTPAVGVPALQVDVCPVSAPQRRHGSGQVANPSPAGGPDGARACWRRRCVARHAATAAVAAAVRAAPAASGAGAAAAGVATEAAGPGRHAACVAQARPGRCPLEPDGGRSLSVEAPTAAGAVDAAGLGVGILMAATGHTCASPHTHIHTKRAPLVSFEGRSYRLSMIEVGCSEQDKPRVAMFKLGYAANSLAWPAAKGPSWLTVIRLCAISQASSSVTSVWTLCRLDGFS